MLSAENFKEASLQDWAADVSRAYGDKDRKRGVGLIWEYMVDNASEIAEALRKEDIILATYTLADIFIWTCGFINRCKVARHDSFRIAQDASFDDIVWHKYPAACPACAQRICSCSSLGIDRMSAKEREEQRLRVERTMKAFRKQTEKKPGTLDAWVQMNANIYRGRYEDSSLIQVGLHFLEEVGEVAREIIEGYEVHESVKDERTERTRKNLEGEIADIFSWTTAMFLKLRPNILSVNVFLNRFFLLENVPRTLEFSDILWQRWNEHPR